jgi:uncharacterized delta-60 repeat protein
MSQLLVNEITPYTGLTVTINGVVISGGTISATTYNNLPLDINVTGGTYSDGTAVFTNNTGGTFSVGGFYTGATDVNITGGTYSDGTATFTNVTGGTFSVTGFTTPFTGGTVDGQTFFNAGLSATTISATTYLNLSGSTYANVAYVDALNGNNATAQINRVDRPFLTIQAAVSACDAITGGTIGSVLDTANNFDIGNGANGGIGGFGGIALQSDGKAIIGGDFTQYNFTNINRIARVNTNGSIDGTFVVGTGFNSSVISVVSSSGNSVIVGGAFTEYSGIPINRICKLNSNGTLDTTFATNIGTGANAVVYGIREQSDGKILVTGEFTSFNGLSINRIIRLNSDGTTDTGFTSNVGTGVGSTGYLAGFSFGLQSDGKILLVGSYTTFNSISYNRIVRLNTDGTVDATFSAGTGFNNITWCIEVLNDNTILIGGDFTSYNGSTANRFMKLTANGDRDMSFLLSTGFGSVSGLTVRPRVIRGLSDGKILIAGSFFNFNGTQTSVSMIRLSSDGSIDPTFPLKAQTNGPIQAMVVRPTGQILIGGGNFTDYDGIPTNNFAQLVDGKLDTQLVYVRRGSYYLTSQITLLNRVDIYCEQGVFLHGWVQFHDNFLPVISNILGYARISSVNNGGNTGVFFISGPSYINIEFDEVNTDTQLVRSFIGSSRNQINIRGNRVQATGVSLGSGIAFRNAGNMNLTLREYFRATNSIFDFRANTGTLNINIPRVVLLATGYYGGNEKQIFYIRDAAARKGRINFVGDLEIEDFANPGGINGAFRFFNNANCDVTFKGNINSRKLIAIAMESGSSNMTFEGTLSTEQTAISVAASCSLHVKNSNFIRTTDTVAGPIGVSGSGTLYINDSTIYSSFLNGNIINVGSTSSRLYMKNVLLEGVGSGSCVNVSTFTGATVGLINTFSNLTNSAGFINSYSGGSFTTQANLNVPKFI